MRYWGKWISSASWCMARRMLRTWVLWLARLKHPMETITLQFLVGVSKSISTLALSGLWSVNMCSKIVFFSLGMGWFWDAEVAFGCLPGVIFTTVGYAGGTTEAPSYYKYAYYKHHLLFVPFFNNKPSQDGRPYRMCTSHFRPWEDWISRHPQCFLAKPWLHSKDISVRMNFGQCISDIFFWYILNYSSL